MRIVYDLQGEPIRFRRRYRTRSGETFGMFTLIVIHDVDRLAIQRVGLHTRIRAAGGRVIGTMIEIPCDAATTTASRSDVEEIFDDIVDMLGAVSLVASTGTITESQLGLTIERSLSAFDDLIALYAEFLKSHVASGLLVVMPR